jgi:ATP-dependent Lhr-like helicase
VNPDHVLIRREGSETRWWTWAGYRANLTLQTSLGRIAATSGIADYYVRLRSEYQVSELSEALAELEIIPPKPDPRAVNGLKFGTTLAPDLAMSTLAARLADFRGARTALDAPRKFVL